MTTPSQRLTLTLETSPDHGIRDLRRLLKALLRRYRLTCIAIAPTTPEAFASVSEQQYDQNHE